MIYLLETDASITLCDSKGNTALIYAAMNRNHSNGAATADLLFSSGDPKPELVNNEGETAMDVAVESGNEGLTKLLLAKL